MKTNSSRISSRSSFDSPDILALIDDFVSLAAAHGIRVSGYESKESGAAFSKLPPPIQKSIFQSFEAYLTLLKMMVHRGVHLRDDRSLAWNAFQLLELTPRGDVLGQVRSGDVIEFYNKEHIQIFRNLRFFELCTYSVFDVLIHDWQSLYQRAEATSTLLYDQMNEVLLTGGPTRQFVMADHELREKFSKEKAVFWIEMGVRSPLYKNASSNSSVKPDALLMTLRATRKDSASSEKFANYAT
jgi:hypothetical protein